MKTLVISQREVPALLPMKACIDVMADVLKSASRGDTVLPLRSKMQIPGRSGVLGLMPASLGQPPVMGLKVVSVFPGNHGTPFDSHQGVVLLFEVEHGSLLAVIDATSITAIRTAAASGAATRLLAREDASDLAILGSGVQARTHLEAMRAVRPLRRIRVWSRDPENTRAFAARESRGAGVKVEVAGTAREAVEGADLICTTTASRDPVLQGDWIAEGAHVNAAGACFPTARELDTRAVVRARLYVDRREATLAEAGDFIIPKNEGAIGEDHIVGEVGEALLGRVPGRRSRDEITLFKSLGIAVEDLAAAHHIYRAALERGDAMVIELGGRRDAGP